MFNVEIEAPSLRAVLQSALSCASKDESRPYMQAVAFSQHRERVMVEATDGHCGFQATLERANINGRVDESFPVKRADIETIVRALAPYRTPKQPTAKRGDKAKPARIPAPMVTLKVDGGAVSIETPDTTLTFKVVDVKFPPLERVMPKRATDSATNAARVVGFNPDLLARAMAAVGNMNTADGVVFTWPTNACDPARVDVYGTSTIPGVVEASAVIMPMRI